MYMIFLDTETTGLDPLYHRIIEIAYRVMRSSDGAILVSYHAIIAQDAEAWQEANPVSMNIHGLTWKHVKEGLAPEQVAEEMIDSLREIPMEKAVFVCQNPSFDRPFVYQLIPVNQQQRLGWPYHWLDLASMYWAYRHFQGSDDYLVDQELSKNQIARHFDLPPEHHPHRALSGVDHLIACYQKLFASCK